jgi:hypothetical protein
MIKSVDLLHYRAVKTEFGSPSSTTEVQNSFCDYAEILLFYDETEDTTLGDISRNLLQGRNDGQVTL